MLSSEELASNCPKRDCRNRGSACFRCQGENGGYLLYRPKARSFRKRKSQKPGMGFQRKVGAAYERATGKKAIQQPNSGAIWFLPGDVKMEEFLIECKETTLKGGSKQFTVTKEMLDKIEEEAGSSRPGVLAFGFKNSDRVYLIGRYDFWLGLVQEINRLRGELSELRRHNNSEG